MKPLAIDLFCGLGGWTEALQAEGWNVVGFDIEAHDYGSGGYPAQLVLQDVRTLHGAQFKDADLIVASPPCQFFSRMAMPFKCSWKQEEFERRRNLAHELFWQCWRIQHEACEAAGRYIPMIVENVVGAQRWVGEARWHYGSFYLWGDVPPLMPVSGSVPKVGGFSWSDFGKPDYVARGFNVEAAKNGLIGGGSWFGISKTNTVLGMNPDGRRIAHGAKQLDGTKNRDQAGYERNHPAAFGWKAPRTSSRSSARKAASAQIAKIPKPLAEHIARVFYPHQTSEASA